MVGKGVSEYLKNLFSIKKEMINCSPKQQDLIWIKFYKAFTKEGYKLENLPVYFALIHPDFYYKAGSTIKNNLHWEKKSSFSNQISRTDKCQAILYTGEECVFNLMPDLRGKCQADHIWPNSLGGPSIPSNRMILCQYHNLMKSNNVYIFDWSLIPSWLPNYLDLIYRLKL